VLAESLTIQLQPGPNSRSFAFPLFVKEETYGDVEIKHVWMEKKLVYGQRGKDSALASHIADFFWELCISQGAADNNEAQQSYILARLAPEVRSNASRTVFNDAHLSFNNKLRRRIAKLLTGALRNHTGKGYSPENFRKATRLLGPVRLNHHGRQKYKEVESELLCGSCRRLLVDRDAAIVIARNTWKKFERQWGRHSGFPLEKKVLNVLSYESRAALHRCYAALWEELIPKIREAIKLDPVSEMFLRLWHAEWTDGDADSASMTSMFHGHVFALHPGAGLLLTDSTGKKIMGEFLNAPSNRSRDVLLGALSICMGAYAEAHRTETERRRLGLNQKED
jgi:hypothetical protein